VARIVWREYSWVEYDVALSESPEHWHVPGPEIVLQCYCSLHSLRVEVAPFHQRRLQPQNPVQKLMEQPSCRCLCAGRVAWSQQRAMHLGFLACPVIVAASVVFRWQTARLADCLIL